MYGNVPRPISEWGQPPPKPDRFSEDDPKFVVWKKWHKDRAQATKFGVQKVDGLAVHGFIDARIECESEEMNIIARNFPGKEARWFWRYQNSTRIKDENGNNGHWVLCIRGNMYEGFVGNNGELIKSSSTPTWEAIWHCHHRLFPHLHLTHVDQVDFWLRNTCPAYLPGKTPQDRAYNANVRLTALAREMFGALQKEMQERCRKALDSRGVKEFALTNASAMSYEEKQELFKAADEALMKREQEFDRLYRV